MKREFIIYDPLKIRRELTYTFFSFTKYNAKQTKRTTERAITSAKIEKNWTKVKNIERKKKGIKSLLDDIPLSFPAMIRSLKLQKRASENGFDWENLGDVLKKINEEKEELEIAINNENREEIEEELGDLIFSIINLARKFSIDPESSLRKTNTNLQKLEKLWNEAKNN